MISIIKTFKGDIKLRVGKLNVHLTKNQAKILMNKLKRVLKNLEI